MRNLCVYERYHETLLDVVERAVQDGSGGGGGGSNPPPVDRGCQFGALTLGDDFEIPAGVVCSMQGTRIDGSIKVNRGSALYAVDIVVDGNIQLVENDAAAGDR